MWVSDDRIVRVGDDRCRSSRKRSGSLRADTRSRRRVNGQYILAAVVRNLMISPGTCFQ